MNNAAKWVISIIFAIVVAGIGHGILQGVTGPSEEPIRIGYIGPLTGEAASVGEPGLGGAELAVKEINGAGGVLGRSLTLIAEDDKCSAEGVNAIKKLVEVDRVLAITGPDCSASGGPALPVAQEAGVPVVVRWASAPHLTKIGDYIFRVYPSDAFQGEFVAEFIFNTLKQKRAAVVYVKNDWGQGIKEVFINRFRELGGDIAYEDGVSQESRDLRTQLAKVKEAKVDVFFFPVYMANGVAGLKQAKELGLKMPIIGGDAFDATEVLQSPGGEGVMYSVAVIQNQEDFQKRVTAATGKKADKITAPMAYDAVKIIAAAVEKAGRLDKKAVRDALAATSYEGISSPLIEFDENGDLKAAQFEVKIIRDGKAEPYQPQ